MAKKYEAIYGEQEEPPEFDVIDIDETDEHFRVAKGIIKGDCTINCVNEEAFYKIIEFFQKQIPKKPILDVIFPSGIEWYLCPVCNHNNVEKSDCYCHNCGQALDWSDTK